MSYASGLSEPSINGGYEVLSTGLFAYDSSGNLITQIEESTGELILKSSIAGQRIEINPSNDNEIHFYGDRGDATVEELATIGISAIGSDSVIGNFGSDNADKVAVRARNNTTATPALKVTNAGTGLAAQIDSTSGDALTVNGAAASGSHGISAFAGEYGGTFRCGSIATGYKRGMIRLVADGSATSPTHNADVGAMWVTSAGILYICTGGTTWQKVGAQ